MSTAITETPIQSSETEKKEMLILRTSDEQEFEVEKTIAIQSGTIKNLVDDGDCTSTVFPLPNVDSETLIKVIEYLKGHADANKSKEDLDEFDKSFIKSVSDDKEVHEIFDLVLAANYLDIKELLDLTCQHVADSIKDISAEEARELFNKEDDFTEEEKANIRNQYPFAYE